MTSITVHVIDTETIGKDAGPDRVVEVAVVPLFVPTVEEPCQAEVLLDHRWESFTKPAERISFGAMATHNITEEMVAGAPGLTEALRDYMPSAEGGFPRILSAHNAPFDEGFLRDALETVCGEQEAAAPYWLDTYRCAKHVLPDAEGYSNQSLRYELGLSHPELAPGPAHRALGDALVTSLLLQHLLTIRSLRELCQVQHEPVLMKQFGFGKHKGQPMADVEHSYLRWVVNKSDLGMDEKHTAQHELDRRWAEDNSAREAARVSA